MHIGSVSHSQMYQITDSSGYMVYPHCLLITERGRMLWACLHHNIASWKQARNCTYIYMYLYMYGTYTVYIDNDGSEL